MGSTAIAHVLTLSFFLVMMMVAWASTNEDEDVGSYDSFASIECVAQPPDSLYGGGVLVNPELADGLNGWSPYGGGKLELRSSDGNNFVVATGRKNSYDSASQKLNLTQGFMYTLAAWVQIGGGSSSSAIVKATVAMRKPAGTTYNCAGTVIARNGCWSFLKGGLTPDFSASSATIYFESQDSGVEIWLDSVSLQPFSEEEWRQQQEASIEKFRKRKMVLHAVNGRGHPVKGAKIMLDQTRMEFPFGSAVANTILGNVAYQKWFVKRFNVATFENELKWYSTEPQQGKVSYRDADALLAFCKENNVAMRGHNIFWEDPNYTPQWVRNLRGVEELKAAVESRIRSVVGRYAGEFLNWDVSNELLHFSWFEDKLGPNASSYFFQIARQLDPGTPLFLNDYNTIENCNDFKVIADAYLQKLQEIQTYYDNNNNNNNIDDRLMEGIGLEGHFTAKPNIPLVRSILDKLGSTRLPIWLTEVDIMNSMDQKTQAIFLEEILREAFSHPSVDGIVLWTALHPNGCYRMCLTDNNLNNLPAGDVVDKLIGEWSSKGISGTTDNSGTFTFSGFAGDYTATISYYHMNITTSFKLSINGPADGGDDPHLHHIHVRLD
eukprot:Gb_02219 [translate_table: standard]